jgi:hypothetical protein
MTSCRPFRLVVNGTSIPSPNGGVDIFEFDADAGDAIDKVHDADCSELLVLLKLPHGGVELPGTHFGFEAGKIILAVLSHRLCEGRNLVIEFRYGDDVDQARAQLAEQVQLPVESAALLR